MRQRIGYSAKSQWADIADFVPGADGNTPKGWLLRQKPVGGHR